ncbi:hypothetical protein AALO_G00088400 [Alosa alosa]|uniref:VWFA domain-containing protein n=1 Tax=Alosa alosa TaxID=278164 RepID=A0AAV6H4T7_9TELE|nr:hypothetical protein AALO_G00088400 [Alosa alosa]
MLRLFSQRTNNDFVSTVALHGGTEWVFHCSTHCACLYRLFYVYTGGTTSACGYCLPSGWIYECESRPVHSHEGICNFVNRKGFEKQVDSIVQRQGGTNTGNAVGKVVKYMFHSFAGARPGAKRILIIITDGQTYDSSTYPSVTAKADGKKITRYAIGVGSAWTSRTARNQLNAIASKPESDHVFEVDNFDALNNIRKALENQLLNIQGMPTVNQDAGGVACVFPFV